MTLLRLNADRGEIRLHGTRADGVRALEAALNPGEAGPVVALVHGFKYRPGLGRHCPHRTIFAAPQADVPQDVGESWLPGLRMGPGRGAGADPRAGLGIAFGWDARGALRRAARQAREAGRALAAVLTQVRARAPGRAVHILAHSLGAEVALEALHHMPGGTVDRVIALTGASWQSRARAALDTPAGRAAELINVTSRENDLFDFLFERLMDPPLPGDAALGRGLAAENAVTVQIDCAATLGFLRRRGSPVAAPERRICHWSAYTRPGVMAFYGALLRRPEDWPLAALKAGLPQEQAARWSRLSLRAPERWDLQGARQMS